MPGGADGKERNVNTGNAFEGWDLHEPAPPTPSTQCFSREDEFKEPVRARHCRLWRKPMASAPHQAICERDAVAAPRSSSERLAGAAVEGGQSPVQGAGLDSVEARSASRYGLVCAAESPSFSCAS